MYDQIRETGKIVIMGDFSLPSNYGETFEISADGMWTDWHNKWLFPEAIYQELCWQ